MTKVYIHVSTTFCRDLLHSLWQRQSSRAAFCCVLIHVSRSRMKGCWAHLPWDHVSTWSHGEEREKGWKEGKGRWRGRRREGEEGIARERDLGAEGPRGRGFPFLREKEASPPHEFSPPYEGPQREGGERGCISREEMMMLVPGARSLGRRTTTRVLGPRAALLSDAAAPLSAQRNEKCDRKRIKKRECDEIH